MMPPLHVRLVRAHRLDPETGCWVWQRATSAGYGRIKVDGRLALAHRVSWELFRGPINNGLQIDHLCRNRACINPRHLELVTHAENVRRGVPFRDVPKRCPRDHEPDWRTWSGQRVCHPCSVLLKRRRRLLTDIESRLVDLRAAS